MFFQCSKTEILRKDVLLSKRMIFVNTTTKTEVSGSTGEQEQQKAKETQDLGERKILERLNKPPDEQKDFISKRVEDTHNTIRDLVENWNIHEFGSVVSKPLLKVFNRLGLTQGDNINQILLSDRLEDIARQEAARYALPILNDTKAIQEYANSAINLVSYKIIACDKLTKDVESELTSLRERKEIIAKANRGISALLSNAKDWAKAPFSSDNLRGRIQRLEELQTRIQQVREETEKRQEVKGKREEQIRQWHEGITALITPYLGEDEMPEFQNLLRNAVLHKTENAESQFEAFVKSKNIKTDSEKIAIKNLLAYLIDGNYRGKAPPFSEKISDYVGAIRAADTRNYFQRQIVEVGQTNEKGIEEQLKFLASEKAKVEEQKVKIGSDVFILESKDQDGFMLRMKGKKGFINTRNKEEPIFTLQAEGNSEPKFSRFKLVKSDLKETGAIAFKIVKIEDEKTVASPAEEKKTDTAEKPQETSRLVEAVTRLIEQAQQLLSRAAHSTPAAKS